MAEKRTGLSNKIRFEVFKRDSFKCQYCGKSAPDVILNVDHISPVAKGGKNDILNLVTSCFECNSGKSDRLLSDNSIVTIQRKQLDELSQRREQIDMLIEWKKIISDNSYEIDSIIKYFNDKSDSNISLTPIGIKNLKVLLKKYSIENVLDAINAAHDRYSDLPVEEIWSKIPAVIGFITATDSGKQKMKFYGAIKSKFLNSYYYNQSYILETNRNIKELFQVIDEGTTRLTYQYLFTVLNRNDNYRDFSLDIINLNEF